MTAVLGILHPFFISVIDITHNPKEAAVEISVRIFTDDLEKTLQKFSGSKIDLINPSNKAFVEKQVAAYLADHIVLKVNGKGVGMQYLGYEIQQESTWSYFEIKGIQELKKIEIDCSLLHDFEKKQVNMIHVKSKGTEKSYKLDYPERTRMIEF